MNYLFSKKNNFQIIINDHCPKMDKKHNINNMKLSISYYKFIGENIISDERKVLIKSSDLLKKFKSLED